MVFPILKKIFFNSVHKIFIRTFHDILVGPNIAILSFICAVPCHCYKTFIFMFFVTSFRQCPPPFLPSKWGLFTPRQLILLENTLSYPSCLNSRVSPEWLGQ
jgi:hypothetical protein